MTADLRARIARELADHAQSDRGLDADHYPPERWLCCADAVLAVLDENEPDDLDRFIREQAAADPRFAAEYIQAQHAATVRAREDLLGDISLYVDWRFVTKQLTTEQKTLWADAHDAWAARMGHEDPSKAERWWAQ